MRRHEEQLPIYEVKGCRCEGVLLKEGFVRGISFRRIRSFLEKD